MRGQGARVRHGVVGTPRDNSTGAKVAVSTDSSVSVHGAGRWREHLLGVYGTVPGPGEG